MDTTGENSKPRPHKFIFLALIFCLCALVFSAGVLVYCEGIAPKMLMNRVASGDACFALAEETHYDDDGEISTTTSYTYEDGALKRSSGVQGSQAGNEQSDWDEITREYTNGDDGVPTSVDVEGAPWDTEKLKVTSSLQDGRPEVIECTASSGKTRARFQYGCDYSVKSIKAFRMTSRSGDMSCTFNSEGCLEAAKVFSTNTETYTDVFGYTHESNHVKTSYLSNEYDHDYAGRVSSVTASYVSTDSDSDPADSVEEESRYEYDDYGNVIAEYVDGQMTAKYSYVLIENPTPWLWTMSSVQGPFQSLLRNW